MSNRNRMTPAQQREWTKELTGFACEFALDVLICSEKGMKPSKEMEAKAVAFMKRVGIIKQAGGWEDTRKLLGEEEGNG